MGTQQDFVAAGELRSARNPIWRCAGNRSDHQVAGGRPMLGRIGVGETEHVARELEQRMLKSAASAEKRPVANAGELDSPQRAVHAGVRRPGSRKKAVVFAE